MPFLSRPLFALLLATISLAGTIQPRIALAEETAPIRQVVLTRDKVSRMLAAYPDLRALGRKYEKENRKAPNADKNPFGALAGYMRHQAARAEMENVLAAHSFSDFTEWLNVARSVALAYGFVKSGRTPQQLNTQVEQALAGIRDNPRLTAEQKARMEAMVRRQISQLKRYEPLPDNIEIAKAMRAEIGAVMDSR